MGMTSPSGCSCCQGPYSTSLWPGRDLTFISKSSLRNFYERFTGLSGQELEKVTENGYKNASASGDYELNFDSYKLLFSNFLLGKTIYGPGKYIFGCFDNRDMDETYKVIYDNV